MSLTFTLTDCPPQPSASVEELNNTLVKMRKVVKVAKVFAFRDLTRYIRKLRLKLTKSPENQRLQHKLNNRTSELQILNQLSVIRLCKLLLANENTGNELSQNGHKMSAQDRLVVRVATTKPVASFVQSFRETHPDWRSLVHYMLYKNISGKWKTREQKKRNRKVRGALPLPPSTDFTSLDEEDNAETRTTPSTSYRIQPHSTSPPSKPPLKMDPPKFDDSGLDSDAASDIADEVVSRLVARGDRPPTLPIVTTPGDRSLPHSLPKQPDSKSQLTEIHRPCNKVERIPSLRAMKRQTSTKEISSDSDKPLPKRPASPDPESPRVPQMNDSDDENPLGSDDVILREQLSKRQRPKWLPPINRSQVPFVKPPSTKGRPGQFRALGRTQAPQRPAQSNEPKVLHPSWQAKREEKMKAQLTSNPIGAAKRIVFDD